MSTTASRKLSASLEDYLEAVLVLIRRKRVARVRDIARRLDVGMPSVTAALKTLSKRGLVNYDPYEAITLTARGREVAEEISQRHHAIRRFLTDVLGLDAETAETNACRMEHAVDDALLRRLRRFVEFISTCPRAGDDWIRRFTEFCSENRQVQQCRDCIDEAVESFQQSYGGKDGDQPPSDDS